MNNTRRKFIERYIAMRREKRNNDRQHAKALGYINKLIDKLRSVGVTEQL